MLRRIALLFISALAYAGVTRVEITQRHDLAMVNYEEIIGKVYFAVDPKLDPHLYLYDPSGKLIAENDDIDGGKNRNSRIEITLPSTGQYTIRISAFADGGAYKLTVTSS